MNGSLEEEGRMIVCDKVCLGLVLTPSLLSHDKGQSLLGDETPGVGLYDNWVPFGGSVFRQIRRQLGHEADKAFPCIYVAQSFPCGPAGKESACIAGDLASIPGLWRCPGEEKGYQPQYSGLENSMDCTVQGLQSQTWLSDFHFSRAYSSK